MVFQLVAAAFIAGIITFFAGLSSIKKKRLIENTPTSKIRSIAMGPVEIKGKAQIAKPFTSPMSGKKCAYLAMTIQEYRSSGKSGRWVTKWANVEGRYFQIKDETGKVTVDSLGAKIEVKPKTYSASGLWGQNKKLVDYVESKGLKTRGFLGFSKQMRLIEKAILIGAELYVFGNAENNPLVEDGTAEKNEDDVIIKGSKKVPFFISEKKEEDLLKKHRLWSTYGIPAGIFLIAISVLLFIIML